MLATVANALESVRTPSNTGSAISIFPVFFNHCYVVPETLSQSPYIVYISGEAYITCITCVYHLQPGYFRLGGGGAKAGLGMTLAVSHWWCFILLTDRQRIPVLHGPIGLRDGRMCVIFHQ